MALTTFAADLAVAASGAAGLTNTKMDIFTNVHGSTNGKNAVFADFTIATYTGYAQATVAFGTAYITQPDNVVAIPSGESTYSGPSSGAGVDAYGWVITDGTSHTVWAWGLFDAGPLSLQNPTDRVFVNVYVELPNVAKQDVHT